MSERDGIMLAIECVDRHNHGFIGCDPMFIHGYNEAVKTISKELGAILETPLIGGDYFEGFSEGIKVGRNEMIEASDEITRLREELAAVTERMSKLDFERTAAELERDALREENARLRRLLVEAQDYIDDVYDPLYISIGQELEILNIAAAIREGGKDEN